MKIAIIIIRVLMGLLFLMSSVIYLFKLVPIPEQTGSVKIFNDGLNAVIYLMPLVKVIELICAIAFISGRYVTLASVVIFPIVVNIFLFHAFISHEGLPAAIFVLLSTLFLAYTNRKNYTSLFIPK